jgi:hypothetical protein
MSSFLRPAFQGPTDIISGRLWTSPENEKQLRVALRFDFNVLIQRAISMILGQILVDKAMVCAICCDRMSESHPV